ncbi:MAG: YggS family pyridoxal phosphate-dependent enzyme [Armatimonadetes bacterium]|nr:YggS family pyridoxal phosphate-dependent enzyme [Armatimonadota bacterium]
MPTIRENILAVQERIANAARRSGRPPGAVTLVAVTKTIDPERIREAIAAGANNLGENYIQEAVPKIEAVGHGVKWHFIGHLQTNKARFAALHFDMVQTVDDLKVARNLSRKAEAVGRNIEVLIEVNIAAEEQKSGVQPEAAVDLAGEVASLPSLELAGLMGMPPFLKKTEETRPFFRKLKDIFDALPKEHQIYLSMGMTGDFEAAVEEGSTMVRIGTAIFGPRT